WRASRASMPPDRVMRSSSTGSEGILREVPSEGVEGEGRPSFSFQKEEEEVHGLQREGLHHVQAIDPCLTAAPADADRPTCVDARVTLVGANVGRAGSALFFRARGLRGRVDAPVN